MNETTVAVVGNMVDDVEYRYTPKGVPVASFRVASNERRWNRVTETFEDGDTLFVRVTCWRRLAERVNAQLAKGDPVVVQGRLYSRVYEDREGIRRTSTQLDATVVGIDVGRRAVTIHRPDRVAAGGASGTEERAFGPDGAEEPENVDRELGADAGGSDDPWSAAGLPEEAEVDEAATAEFLPDETSDDQRELVEALPGAGR